MRIAFLRSQIWIQIKILNLFVLMFKQKPENSAKRCGSQLRLSERILKIILHLDLHACVSTKNLKCVYITDHIN